MSKAEELKARLTAATGPDDINKWSSQNCVADHFWCDVCLPMGLDPDTFDALNLGDFWEVGAYESAVIALTEAVLPGRYIKINIGRQPDETWVWVEGETTGHPAYGNTCIALLLAAVSALIEREKNDAPA